MSGGQQSSFWLSKGLWSLTEKGLSLCFGLGSFLVLIRLLSKEQFGAWVLFMTVCSILEVAKNGFLQNAFLRFWQIYPKKQGQTLSITLLYNVVLTGLYSIGLWFGSDYLATLWDAPTIAYLLKVHILWQFLVIGLQLSSYTLQSEYHFQKITWLTLLRQGLFFFLVLVLFVKGASVELIWLGWAQVFIIAIVSLIAISFVYSKWHFSMPSQRLAKEFFHYGKYVFGTNISAMIYKSIDKWMLGSMLGKVVVAPYEACMRVLLILEQPTYSVAAIVFPKGAEKMRNNNLEELKSLYERAVGAILGIILPVVTIVLLFPQEVLYFLAGEEYIEYHRILRLAMIIGVLSPYLNQFGTLLDVMGKPKVNFYCIILGAVSNILFNYFFISKYGLDGAIYGTLASYILLFVVNQVILFQLFKLNPVSPLRQIPFLYSILWNKVRFNYNL